MVTGRQTQVTFPFIILVPTDKVNNVTKAKTIKNEYTIIVTHIPVNRFSFVRSILITGFSNVTDTGFEVLTM